MNYVKKFRILPYSIFFNKFLTIILIFQSCVDGSNDQTTKTIDLRSNQKPVFNINFPKNNRYSIDDCIPVAFGDFNADKVVDIFCLNSEGNSIRIIFNDDRSTTSNENCSVNVTGIIYDALAADFNGDSNLDLFVVYKNDSDQTGFHSGIFWGNRVTLGTMQPIEYLFQSPPTTLDANGDSYVELLGMVSVNHSAFQPACVFLHNDSVSNVQYLTSIEDLRPDSTQGSADLNNDYIADLFLTLETVNGTKFAVYNLPISQLTLIREYSPPVDAAILLLSLFVDIDADGELEHVQPVCMDFNCTDSRVYIYDNNTWYQIPIPFGDAVKFPLSDQLPPPFNRIPQSLKVADYNLDGYPDMVAVMEEAATNTTVSVVLLNQPCQGDANSPCTYNRTLIPQTQEKYVLGATNATLAAFLDLLENGLCDLLVVQATDNQTYRLTAFYNSLVQDVHFIKVMVLSSFICSSCPNQYKLPYGNNEPGQVVKMETLSITNVLADNLVRLAAVQMGHAGQLSLEMPYVIIGLGSTPNFVERITVGLPPNAESNKLYRTYTQMIPNSQVVVIPIPLMNPEKWHSKLFLTPSRMILNTGIALSVTLVVLVSVVAILQYREKIEDDRERKAQAQAFHYDAL